MAEASASATLSSSLNDDDASPKNLQFSTVLMTVADNKVLCTGGQTMTISAQPIIVQLTDGTLAHFPSQVFDERPIHHQQDDLSVDLPQQQIDSILHNIQSIAQPIDNQFSDDIFIASASSIIPNETDTNSTTSMAERQASAGNLVNCPLCQLQLKNPKNLRAHMQTHSDTKHFQCTVCSKSFRRSNQLKSHQKVHTGERPYECSICLKTFSQSSNYLVHKNTHLDLPVDRTLRYPCTICQRSFAQPLYLKSHMRVHTARDPRRCRLCRRKYELPADLEQHEREHIGPDRFQCLECGKEFERYINLKNHRFTHNGLKPYACKVCSKPFAHTTSLAVHMRTHTGEKPYACTVCERTFSQWANFHRHLGTHQRESAEFECAECGQHFAKVSALKSHLRSRKCGIKTEVGVSSEANVMKSKKRNPRRVKCDICTERFVNTDEIREHMKQKHERASTPLYKCDECDDDFWADELTLELHVREQHEAYIRHGCPYCRHDFVHTDLLLAHLQEHLGQKQCEQCGKLFRKFGLYKRHQCMRAVYRREMEEREREIDNRLELRKAMLVDQHAKRMSVGEVVVRAAETSLLDDATEDADDCSDMASTANENNEPTMKELPPSAIRQFPCTICSLNFSTAKRLRFHTQSHHTERRHRCEHCSLAFVRSSELMSHRRSHTGERPYQCEICSKCFTQSSALYTHQRVHSGERPYACAICAKRFKQTSACKRHEALHSGEKPLMCQHCGKAFANADGLKIHSRTHQNAGRSSSGSRAPDGMAVRTMRRKETTAKPNPVRAIRQHRSAPARASSPPELGPNGYYGDLPYPCEVCRKTFAKACTLWVHSKIHTGEKNHRCDQCPKAFAQAANLKRHRLSHNGKRPHQCYVCTKWFAKSETLEAHQELHRAAERASAVTVLQVSGVQPQLTAIVVNKKCE